MKKKWLYEFGIEKTHHKSPDINLLGGKGFSLATMTEMGIQVPPGFTIITDLCNLYTQNNNPNDAPHNVTTLKSINKNIDTKNHQLINEVHSQVKVALKAIEKKVGRKFGDFHNGPLLLSVRSGAITSMPGMMDTILNLGLNDQTVKALALQTKNEQFAYDSYRRFIQMYGNVVMSIPSGIFEAIIYKYKHLYQIKEDNKIPAKILRLIIADFKNAIKNSTNKDIPTNVYEQLWNSIKAVFQSWHNPRAIKYREINKISHNIGTAVNIQTMVFGNLGQSSCTGVIFSSNPNSGDNSLFGEFLINAQGEDIVAGTHNAQPVNIATKQYQHKNSLSMEETMPNLYQELVTIAKKLELHYADMQDIEFTVEEGKLWILQSRKGKRSIEASLKIALTMIKKHNISPQKAIKSIDANKINGLLHPTLIESHNQNPIAQGLAASPGAASGKIVFDSHSAETQSLKEKVILVRNETSPEDIGGMSAAQGIITSRGGMTSHAAVVTRGMGKPCVCGANQLLIDSQAKTLTTQEAQETLILKEGDLITIDGSSGLIFKGEIPTRQNTLPKTFYDIIAIAKKEGKIKVMANAETIPDIKAALDMGAEGVGLCRTEHMFFKPERIRYMRDMILSTDHNERAKSLEKLYLYQKTDFIEILSLTQKQQITIRLLDPPLHEFLPQSEDEILDYCQKSGKKTQITQSILAQLREQNPMLGHRGCRLALTFPEIYKMQLRAIFHAICEIQKTNSETNTQHQQRNHSITPEIMIPFISNVNELLFCKNLVIEIAKEIETEKCLKQPLNYKIGVMIELPAAIMNATQIAKHVDFISFGTNDLTQTTLGISRDDAGSFLKHYISNHIIDCDPFVSIDTTTVGKLIKIAIDDIRQMEQKNNPENHHNNRNNHNNKNNSKQIHKRIKIGVCGEHGGDTASIEFFKEIGVDYVSCSPYRVPLAIFTSV